MGWYVSRDGDVQGPFDGIEIRHMGDAGHLVPGMHVRDEASNAWSRIEQSPLAEFVVSGLPLQSSASGSETLGYVLLALPFFAAFLIVFWVGKMDSLQARYDTLGNITGLTIFITAIIMAAEAAELGMGKPIDGRATKGPFRWFIGGCLIWPVAYPAYLYARKRFGRKSLIVEGLLVVLCFFGASIVMGWRIERKREEVMQRRDDAREQAQRLWHFAQ